MVAVPVLSFTFELPPSPWALADKAVSCDELGPALAESPPGRGDCQGEEGRGPLVSAKIREPG